MAYLLGFPYTQSFTLDINTTVSTWNEAMVLITTYTLKIDANVIALSLSRLEYVHPSLLSERYVYRLLSTVFTSKNSS